MQSISNSAKCLPDEYFVLLRWLLHMQCIHHLFVMHLRSNWKMSIGVINLRVSLIVPPPKDPARLDIEPRSMRTLHSTTVHYLAHASFFLLACMLAFRNWANEKVSISALSCRPVGGVERRSVSCLLAHLDQCLLENSGRDTFSINADRNALAFNKQFSPHVKLASPEQ